MRKIEPTHKEIMKYLNCCHYSYWNKNQCECHNPKQFKLCYEQAKQQLTHTEYTEEEIEELKKQAKQNGCKSEEAFELFYKYCEGEEN